MDAGSKSLCPALSKRLNSWGTQCRQAPRQYCIPLSALNAATASTAWQLLLFESHADFVERWAELQVVRDDIVAAALDDYDGIVERNAIYWEREARRSWRALQNRYTGAVALSIRETGVTFGPEDEDLYVAWVVNKVRDEMPSRNAINTKIYAEYHTSILFSESDVATEDAVLAESEAREAVAEASIITAREIRASELGKAREALAGVVDPFAEAMESLLRQIQESVKAVLDTHAKSGTFRGRSLTPAKNLLALYRRLGGALLDNSELERLIAELTTAVNAKPTDKAQREISVNQIVDRLNQIQSVVNSEARDLARLRSLQTRGRTLDL